MKYTYIPQKIQWNIAIKISIKSQRTQKHSTRQQNERKKTKPKLECIHRILIPHTAVLVLSPVSSL